MNNKVSAFLPALRPLVAAVFLIPALISLSGCDYARGQLKHDREGGMEAQDYRNALAPRLPDPEEGFESDKTGSVPELQPYVATETQNMKSMPLVSISVNQSVPLRDVLFELARQAEYDVELDPQITGAIIFSAKDRPFDQVISRICDISGLRHSFDDDILRVEIDRPYNKTFKIDYLSYIRSAKSSIKNNIAVVTGDGADTGSNYEASGSSETDFWGELEQNIGHIMGSTKVSGALKTKKTPKITAVEQNVVQTTDANGQPVVPAPVDPAAAAAAAQNPAAGEEGLTDNAAAITAQATQDPSAVAAAPAGTPAAAPQGPSEAVLRVESLPDEEDAGDDTAAGGTEDYTFTINKQAGLINVYAPDKVQKQVDQYLHVVRRAVTAQVQIEAKVLEVTLNDDYEAGVDWSVLDSQIRGLDFSYIGPNATNTLIEETSNAAGGLVIGYASNNFEALVEAVSRFGTVKSLASPRMTVLNNQPAVLNVATNRVYFELDIDVTTEEGVTQTEISSEAHNVPEGVLINVQPSINLDNGTIALAVRPTVTKIEDRIVDPAVAYITEQNDIEGVTSLIPELNVQEIDSVIQVKSGQPIVMGGLQQDRMMSDDDGIPGVSELPMFGSLFKQHADLVQKTELIIFLKATILENPADSVAAADKDFYRNFSGDRRPLRFAK